MAVSASTIKTPRARDLRALPISSLDWLIITVADHRSPVTAQSRRKGHRISAPCDRTNLMKRASEIDSGVRDQSMRRATILTLSRVLGAGLGEGGGAPDPELLLADRN